MSTGKPGARQGKAVVLLDAEELLMLDCFRKLRKHGFGRLETVIVEGKLCVINFTKTFEQQDAANVRDTDLVPID